MRFNTGIRVYAGFGSCSNPDANNRCVTILQPSRPDNSPIVAFERKNLYYFLKGSFLMDYGDAVYERTSPEILTNQWNTYQEFFFYDKPCKIELGKDNRLDYVTFFSNKFDLNTGKTKKHTLLQNSSISSAASDNSILYIVNPNLSNSANVLITVSGQEPISESIPSVTGITLRPTGEFTISTTDEVYAFFIDGNS